MDEADRKIGKDTMIDPSDFDKIASEPTEAKKEEVPEETSESILEDLVQQTQEPEGATDGGLPKPEEIARQLRDLHERNFKEMNFKPTQSVKYDKPADFKAKPPHKDIPFHVRALRVMVQTLDVLNRVFPTVIEHEGITYRHMAFHRRCGFICAPNPFQEGYDNFELVLYGGANELSDEVLADRFAQSSIGLDAAKVVSRDLFAIHESNVFTCRPNNIMSKVVPDIDIDAALAEQVMAQIMKVRSLTQSDTHVVNIVTRDGTKLSWTVPSATDGDKVIGFLRGKVYNTRDNLLLDHVNPMYEYQDGREDLKVEVGFCAVFRDGTVAFARHDPLRPNQKPPYTGDDQMGGDVSAAVSLMDRLDDYDKRGDAFITTETDSQPG